VIARWKGIIEEIHFGGSIMPLAIIENLDLEKPSFRPSKWPRKLKPAKNSKLPKLPENSFEPVGKGGWPPISTWIIRYSANYYPQGNKVAESTNKNLVRILKKMVADNQGIGIIYSTTLYGQIELHPRNL
jgi:hypothetical protein